MPILLVNIIGFALERRNLSLERLDLGFEGHDRGERILLFTPAVVSVVDHHGVSEHDSVLVGRMQPSAFI